MPIGNVYLSEYQVGRVSFPSDLIDYSVVGDHIDTGQYIANKAVAAGASPVLGSLDVAFTKFDVRTESNPKPMELIQGFPTARVLDFPAATYSFDIEVPVILAPSSAAGLSFRVRTNEVAFWLAWLKYMMSTLDRASSGGSEGSVIVERAYCGVSADAISLGLRIVANVQIGWTLLLSSGGTVIGRKASCYDTFVAVENYASGVSPASYRGVGLNDRWGITQLRLDANTSRQDILGTRGGLIGSPSGADWLMPDEINAKMVSYSGNINVFGLVDGWGLDYGADASGQSDRAFWLGTATTDPGASVFTDAMGHGGLCVYVGTYDGGVGTMRGVPLFMLPTGTAVGTTGISAGQGPISISSEFSGVITNAPWQGTGYPYSTL